MHLQYAPVLLRRMIPPHVFDYFNKFHVIHSQKSALSNLARHMLI